jgi:hypothetical protein
MNSLVENIMQEAGDMPNPSAHRRYLQSLTEPVLRARPQKKAGVC